MTLICVDNGCAAALEDAGAPLIGHVDMTVNEIARLILIDQVQQALEAPVSPIAVISALKSRGMGYNDVHSAGSPQFKTQFPDAPCHLPLAVLVGASAVQGAAAQPQDSQSVDSDQLVLDTITAFRRILVIASVMVPVNV
jgi:hypothetical protein